MSSVRMRVLVVDDNPGDVDLIREAFEDPADGIVVTAVQDGDEAVEHLERCAAAPDSTLPQMILLDWNLPCRSGREVLALLKTDPKTRRIPVVVLTSSALNSDVMAAYEQGASCFLVKPIRFERFHTILRLMKEFWLRAVVLPGGRGDDL